MTIRSLKFLKFQLSFHEHTVQKVMKREIMNWLLGKALHNLRFNAWAIKVTKSILSYIDGPEGAAYQGATFEQFTNKKSSKCFIL